MQRRGNRPCARKGACANRLPLPANTTETMPRAASRPSFAAKPQKQTRVQLYLPIADIPVNVFLILAMGAAVGFVSGMFGIGGGFLMTPLLIFVGIAPAVAVASVASHIAASSFSGAISYWRRRAIDPALAMVLLSGGTVGTALGVWTFTLLRSLGQLDLLIALSYVILLTTVGGLMFWEDLRPLLGLLVLAVGVRFAVELVIRPEDLFTIRETGGTG